MGTEGGRAPITWGPRHCQGPGSTLGWDPDLEGRRRSECPASGTEGAQRPGWRASCKVHSGRQALGGQALGPSASVSLRLSLGGTVRVRVHPPTEEGRGATRAPAVTASCRPGTLPLGTAPSAKGPCPGPYLLAEAWKPISGRRGLHPFIPVSLARGLSCVQSALNACRNELQGLFSTWSHRLSCNSVLLQRWTAPLSRLLSLPSWLLPEVPALRAPLPSPTPLARKDDVCAPFFLPGCGGCGAEIKNGQSLVALDKHWHLGCFKCKTCGKQLNAEYISK